ncbi:aromatic ring-hydroxylating dioxygenase subunit alpha [Pantoea sp. Ap-967]|uniref:aromatic ring-hydroxylating oxygenase subunit alpha n=1 Tax=Pantoea sp. Ap-967 TaxID=2608362 RepID=UPI00141E7197|nr:aromatic ring-hydroxylating dioxygenase subunit alpha [Pantoea sp. Ap-967]NIE77997.1 aromatic ring-hydroxylating dioxygenase subunit alpha [Pantoea sp. Ap-967]
MTGCSHHAPVPTPSLTPNLADLYSQCRRGHTLPQTLYTSAAVFDFEMDAVFTRAWLQAGHLAEIPRTGDYITVQLGKTSVVIIRESESVVRGYFNTCRHRGALLCTSDKGSARRLVCPYHQWTYDLGGNLIFARNMPADFDPRQHGLVPVHCEVVAGVIFIALSDDAPDFAEFRHQLEPMLAPHDLENAKVAHSVVLPEYANWKLVMENGRECYHCSARHPELLTAFRDPTEDDYFDAQPDWMKDFEAVCHANGLVNGPAEGAWFDILRFPIKDGVESLTLDGRLACSQLLIPSGEGNIGTLRWATEPNAFSHALRDHAFSFEAWPIDVGTTHVRGKWLVHKNAVEGRDYELAHLTALWNATNDQDKWLAENNFKGVQGRGYVPGPFSVNDEKKVIDFVNWYLDTAQRCLRF